MEARSESRRTGAMRSAIGGSLIVAASISACGGGSGSGSDSTVSTGASQACTELVGRTFASATVATAVANPATAAVPAYCKVVAHIDPSLNFEARLPLAWNGKLHYGGGGGYDGLIPDLNNEILAALVKGYATVSSDAGHQALYDDASWALGNPTAANLFGSGSVPAVMASSIRIVSAVYGSAPRRSYFEGCSNGGREGLMAAQRNPTLFDGIIARAPAYNWVGLMGAYNRTAKALASAGGEFNAGKVALLAKTVRNACDGLDGVVDGIVSNPAACRVDLALLRCAGGRELGDTCLSDAQLAVVSSITSPAVFIGSKATYTNPAWRLTGNEDDPGAWPVWITGGFTSAAIGGLGDLSTAVQFRLQSTTVKTFLARNLSADSLTYVPYDRDPIALDTLSATIDVTDTTLAPYRSRGGKLILWHGGNDTALSNQATTAYYDTLAASAGGEAAASAFMRYYVAPGVNHCSGGPGADVVDLLSAIDAWVESGTSPEVLTASRVDSNGVEFTRPLCRYPQYPRHLGATVGTGSALPASSFVCTTP